MATHSNLTDIISTDFEQKVLKSAIPVIINFWAEWAGPSRVLEPVYESLSDEYRERMAFTKVDVDDQNNASLLTQLDIKSIPIVMIFKGGQMVKKLTPPHPNSLKDEIDSVLIGKVASGQPPSASFFALPSTGQAPLSVEFNATLSSDPDGHIVKYDWDFGDNKTGSGVTSSNTYNTPGTFTVKLTVTDDGGATNSTSSTITVL